MYVELQYTVVNVEHHVVFHRFVAATWIAFATPKTLLGKVVV